MLPEPLRPGVGRIYALRPSRASQVSAPRIYQDRGRASDRERWRRADPLRSADGRVTSYRHDPNNPHSLSYNSVNSVDEGHDGILWVSTLGELNRFDRATGSFTAYRHDPTTHAA
jgi:hypothetical protein